MLKVVSIVAICRLDRSLNLQFISLNLDGAILPKKGGGRVNFRLKPENYYIAFFESGKILITGIKSLEKINTSAQRVLEVLTNVDVQVNITNIQIVNIVCLGSFALNTTLERTIYYLDSKEASYEPEQFPGLIFKKWGATFLLFSNGKVIITGIRDFQKAKKLFKQFIKLVNI